MISLCQHAVSSSFNIWTSLSSLPILSHLYSFCHFNCKGYFVFVSLVLTLLSWPHIDPVPFCITFVYHMLVSLVTYYHVYMNSVLTPKKQEIPNTLKTVEVPTTKPYIIILVSNVIIILTVQTRIKKKKILHFSPMFYWTIPAIKITWYIQQSSHSIASNLFDFRWQLCLVLKKLGDGGSYLYKHDLSLV